MFSLASIKAAAGTLNGMTDILEAFFAGGLYIAAADGSIDRSEAMSVKASATASPFISKLFKADDIEVLWPKITAKLKASPNFREACLKELKDVAGERDEVRQAIYLAMYQTAAADGNVDDDEVKALHVCADALNLTSQDVAEIEAQVADGVTFEDW